MKIVLTILILCITTPAQTPAEHWTVMPPEAQISIRGSYERNPDYGYTLAAFNAIESAGGQFTVRLEENSAGNYAQKARIVAAHLYNIPQDSVTDWQEDRVFQWLITNREFDDSWAVWHLDKLHTQHERDWMKIWGAWNSRKEAQAEETRRWVNFFIYTLKWSRENEVD